jgi:hypothetical protein
MKILCLIFIIRKMQGGFSERYKELSRNRIIVGKTLQGGSTRAGEIANKQKK